MPILFYFEQEKSLNPRAKAIIHDSILKINTSKDHELIS